MLAAGRGHIAGVDRTVIHTLPIGYALDAETEQEFHAQKNPKILLDFRIEEIAGMELTAEERSAIRKQLAKKLRDDALRAQQKSKRQNSG